MGIRVRQQQEKASMQNRSPKSRKHRCWLQAAALYLPTLLQLEALLSLVAWRAGKSTAGQTGRSGSLPHCRRNKNIQLILLETISRTDVVLILINGK